MDDDQCRSTESAARFHFAAIFGPPNGTLDFRVEEYAEGLAGFHVFDPSGKQLGSMVIDEADCRLRFFSDLAVE